MLPALPSPPAFWLRCRTLLLAAGLLLCLNLSACSSQPTLPRATVQSALALQIDLTQTAIAAALDLPEPGAAEVRHVRIDGQRGVSIGTGQGLRVTGLLDWRLGREPGGTDTPFTLYLQRGERGQSWRLARPQGPDDGGLEQQWLIDPLPLPG